MGEGIDGRRGRKREGREREGKGGSKTQKDNWLGLLAATMTLER